MEPYLYISLSGIAGLVVGMGGMIAYSKAGLNKNQQNAERILKDAENEAQARIKQAVLDGKTQAHDLRVEAEKEIKDRRQEATNLENKLLRREDNLNFREEALGQKEHHIDEKMQKVTDKLASLDEKEKVLQEQIDKQIDVLEGVAKMSSQDAKKELFAKVEKKMQRETVAYIKDKEDEAKETATRKSQEIIALSIERMAQMETQERTVSVVSLPGEEMKGRIIGREGRNIRAFEQMTGVELNIDDTPDVITITCFNPVRREVARLALEHLIRDGRIQPGRIEDVVKKYQKEVNQEKSIKSTIIEWIKVFGLAIILAFVITLFIKPTLVRGDSMVPTLHENDYLIINRMVYRMGEPKNGDIIVFKSDLEATDGTNKDLVKRVIGVEGDKVVITNGQVYVNDKLLNEPYLSEGMDTEGEMEVTVPKGKLFVLGDNREVSLDSRYDKVGLVDVSDVEGKVFVRLYPFNDISFIN